MTVRAENKNEKGAKAVKTKRSNSSLWLKSYTAYIVYGLFALIVLLVQNAPRFLPTVMHARPVPVVLLVVCVALFERTRVGVVVGVIAGLLWDLYAFRLFGFSALLMLGIGLGVGLLVEWLLRANFLSAMLLCGGAVLLQALLEWFFCHVIFQKEQVWSLLFRVYLPNALYTLLLAPLMYFAVLWIARLLRRRTNAL